MWRLLRPRHAAPLAAAVLPMSAWRQNTSSPQQKFVAIPVACQAHQNYKTVISVDGGGTNTRVELWKVPLDAEGKPQPVKDKQRPPGVLLEKEDYINDIYEKEGKKFDHIVEDFLNKYCTNSGRTGSGSKEVGTHPWPSAACLALAGVVEQNQVQYSNRTWKVNGYKLSQPDHLNIGFVCPETFEWIGKIQIINDFAAQGYGLLTLADEEYGTLTKGVGRIDGQPMACIGPGTGLGQCFLFPDQKGSYTCFPSEGGHAEFPPCDHGSKKLQSELLNHLKIKFSAFARVDVERVVSGKGICNIYEFLAYNNPDAVDDEIHAEFIATGRENAGVVVRNATRNELCQQALEMFAACYGTQCGTVALQVMPFNGIVVTGGVINRLLNNPLTKSLFADSGKAFQRALRDKGRLSNMVERVPILYVKDGTIELGKLGAQRQAVMLLDDNVRIAKPVNIIAANQLTPPVGAFVFSESLRSRQ